MELVVSESTRANGECIELAPAKNLLQSRFWAYFKQRRGHQSFSFQLQNATAQYVLRGLSRRIGPNSYGLYVPHGPEASPRPGSEGPALEHIAEQMRSSLPDWCVAIRFDLPWQSPYTEEDHFSEAGQWEGPPETRLRELRMNFGTTRRLLRKAPTDLQPPDTVIVDLTKSESELRAAMKAKTRYNVGLAQRKGVSVRRGGTDDLPVFYQLYRETAERQGLAHEEMDYFEDIFKTFEAIAGKPSRRTRTEPRLYLAEYKGHALASAIVFHHGAKAYYLYGGTSLYGRERMPSYLLQWEAMQQARSAGCRSYDMFGVAPNDNTQHPLHGLYRFKCGFPGRLKHYRGCWDYPLQPGIYQAECAQTASAGGAYHI